MTIKEEIVDLQTPAGAMRTCIFRPAADGRYPGLVLFSEIFQVTGPIRRTAAFLAGHGFVVAVPEIFHELESPGAVIPYDAGRR
jgi:carboxymethylenebutenolidase